jgi:hypothetical protein
MGPEIDKHIILDARYSDVAMEARIGLKSLDLAVRKPDRSQSIGGGREHADEETRGKRPSAPHPGQKRNARNGGRAPQWAAIRVNGDPSRCEGAFRLSDAQWTSLLRTAASGQKSGSYEH